MLNFIFKTNYFILGRNLAQDRVPVQNLARDRVQDQNLVQDRDLDQNLVRDPVQNQGQDLDPALQVRRGLIKVKPMKMYSYSICEHMRWVFYKILPPLTVLQDVQFAALKEREYFWKF